MSKWSHGMCLQDKINLEPVTADPSHTPTLPYHLVGPTSGSSHGRGTGGLHRPPTTLPSFHPAPAAGPPLVLSPRHPPHDPTRPQANPFQAHRQIIQGVLVANSRWDPRQNTPVHGSSWWGVIDLAPPRTLYSYFELKYFFLQFKWNNQHLRPFIGPQIGPKLASCVESNGYWLPYYTWGRGTASWGTLGL